MLTMRRHMPPEILFPKETFATNVAMEVFIPNMLDHVLSQNVVIEELDVTNWTSNVLFFQMRPLNMVPHKRVLRKHTIAVSTFVAYIMHSHQMFSFRVIREETLWASRAVIALDAVNLSPVGLQFQPVGEVQPANVAFELFIAVEPGEM